MVNEATEAGSLQELVEVQEAVILDEVKDAIEKPGPQTHAVCHD